MNSVSPLSTKSTISQQRQPKEPGQHCRLRRSRRMNTQRAVAASLFAMSLHDYQHNQTQAAFVTQLNPHFAYPAIRSSIPDQSQLSFQRQYDNSMRSSQVLMATPIYKEKQPRKGNLLSKRLLPRSVTLGSFGDKDTFDVSPIPSENENRESRDSDVNTKKKSNDRVKSSKSNRENEYMSEKAMFDHDMLTMEDEQRLGSAVQLAMKLQSKLDTIIAEKRYKQEQLEESIRQALEDQNPDDSEDDDEFDFSEYEMNSNPNSQQFQARNERNTEQISRIPNDINVLKRLEDESRISQARLIEQEDTDDGETDQTTDSFLLVDDTTSSDDSNINLIDFSSILTDEEVKSRLKLNGGLQELSRILIDGAIARDTLISSNLKLVSSIAKKWSKMSAKANDMSSSNTMYSIYTGGWDRPSLSEAIQEGSIGLVKAVERFNPERGLRFSTYATYWITNSIRQCFQKTSSGTIRLPMNFYEAKSKFKTLVKEYCEQYGRLPTLDVMAKEMKTTPKRLRTILQLTRPLVSIDAPIVRGSTTKPGKAGGNAGNDADEILVSDTLIYEDENDALYNIEMSFLRQCLENAMATELAPHERDVIRLRLGLDDGYSRTCKEVSQFVGGSLSTSEVRSTEQRAFKKLRSPRTLSTYKLLSYLDFADVDTETIRMR